MAKVDKFVNKFVDLYIQAQTKVNGTYLEDPTVMGFNLWFFFTDLPLGPNKNPSPLFSEQPHTDSAIRYLESINESSRASAMKDFRERLRLLVYDTPYYFQTIEGLEGINKFDPTNPFRGHDRKLTINTLESLDLRVSTMIARYMEAVYDFQNHRQMVPQNLLQFSMYVIVNEVRNMRRIIAAKAGDDSERFELLNDSLGVHAYKLEMCTFDFENSNPWLSTIDNKGGDYATNKFSINVGRIAEEHQLTFLQLANGGIPNNPIGSTAPSVNAIPKLSSINSSVLDRARQTVDFVQGEILKKGEMLQQKLDLKILGQRALNDIFDQLDSRVKGFILGNVFSDLNKFIEADFYTSAKDFADNVINKKQSVNDAARNAFGSDGPPEPIQTKIGELGQIAIAVLRQNEVQLGNVAGFDSDPFQAIENQVISGSLGNVFTNG